MTLDALSYPGDRLQQTLGEASVWVRRGRAALIGVGIGVTSRLGHQRGGRGRVSETDHLVHGDAVSSVELHQPIEGRKGLLPDAVLATALEDSEMFHPVTVAVNKSVKASLLSVWETRARVSEWLINLRRFSVALDKHSKLA